MIRKISEKHTEDFCAGNKGKFLNYMNQKGFAVPDGIILDSNEYLEFVRENKLEEKINRLLMQLKNDNVGEISEQLISLFSDAVLSDKVREVLEKTLNNKGYYAVRSSGTKEDLDDYSFAGQYQTFLNVKGLDEIEKNIIACYQSMFSETILSYLVNQNIDVNDLAMAVVVQEMVQADYSGICFTINPISGNDKEMLIEVSEGLGENIVSGKVKPEQYYYNWYECEGTYDNNNKILDKDKLGKIAETFFEIQLLFGYPCDIEFALKDGELYILQARKITKISYTMYQDIWSTADFKDGGVSATVCTPYMWSLYEYIWEFTLRKFMIDSNILKEKEVNRKLGNMFYGRCYWNVCMVKLAMSKVIGYKEREFDSEYGVRITYDGDGDTTKITPASLIAIIRMYFGQKRILKERNENAENYKTDLLNKYNDYRSMYDNNRIDDIEKIWYTLTKKTYLQTKQLISGRFLLIQSINPYIKTVY